MQPFPHHYSVNVLAGATGVVTVRGEELEDIQSSAPPQFGGPPGNWSPETLFLASIADCFVLSFRAVAAASKLEWLDIDCACEGTLEKTREGLSFTRVDLQVQLRIPAAADSERAQRLLEKAEHNCLVSNSIKAQVQLSAQVTAS